MRGHRRVPRTENDPEAMTTWMSSCLTPGSATITSTPASVSKTSIGGSQPTTADGNARPATGFARGIVAIICTHIASAIDLGIGFPSILRRPGAFPAASFP